MIRRLAALATIAVLLLVLLAPTRTYAAPPQIQFIPVSFGHPADDISAVCGFPVTVWDQGTIKLATFYDNAGNPTRDTANFQGFKITFSGNGASFSSPSPDPTTFSYAAGTTTVHGLQLRI